MNFVLTGQDKQKGYGLYRLIIVSVFAVTWLVAAVVCIVMRELLGSALTLFLAIGFGAAAIQQALKIRSN